MFTDIQFLKNDSRIDWETRQVDSDGNRLFDINTNIIELGVQLIVPPIHFFEPSIKVSRKFVLHLPHVDMTGYLCLRETPKNLGLKEQIDFVLESFFGDYIPKILSENFDEDFYKEAKNYWDVFVKLSQDKIQKYIPRVICLNKLDNNSSLLREYYSEYIVTKQMICAVSNVSEYTTRTVNFLSNKSSVRKLRTLEVRLNSSYKPSQFPHNKKELSNLLKPFFSQDLINSYLQIKTEPSLIILRSINCDYAYLINFRIKDKSYYSSNKNFSLIPIYCDKADLDWIYGRYQKPDLSKKQKSRILCLGAGVLGSQVLPLLAREGVGDITLIDYDYFDTPNLGRHYLGVDSLYKRKVFEVKNALKKLPSCKVKAIATSAEVWLTKNSLDNFDLILDLTGSGDVRRHLDYYRRRVSIPLVVGWIEPYVCAGHVAIFGVDNYWKEALWEDIHAFDSWPKGYLANEPGCASRFQSYSGIEANKVISLIAEKVIYAINKPLSQVEVYSFIQNDSYCLQQEYVGERREWAEIDDKYESLFVKRVF